MEEILIEKKLEQKCSGKTQLHWAHQSAFWTKWLICGLPLSLVDKGWTLQDSEQARGARRGGAAARPEEGSRGPGTPRGQEVTGLDAPWAGGDWS